MKTFILDGRGIGYNENTVFLVQVGRYSKGAYKTRYSIVGNPPQAVFIYNCINIGRGYKKRLIAPSIQKKPFWQASS